MENKKIINNDWFEVKKGDREDSNYYVYTTEKGEKIFGQYIFGYGKTEEAAAKSLLKTLAVMLDFYQHRLDKAEKWIPFEHGDFNRIGGTWFRIFGINTYIRYGENMLHGIYIPFTKLNIWITNAWIHKNRKNGRTT